MEDKRMEKERKLNHKPEFLDFDENRTWLEEVSWIAFMHKQNLNGRESEDELFEAGIGSGIKETKGTILCKILKVRDELYDSLPRGEVDAFNLIKLINQHICELDKIIDKLKNEE